MKATIPTLIVAVCLSNDLAIAQTPPPLELLPSLPEDPCAVLTVEQVGAATGTDVIESRRVPSILKVVQAQQEEREPLPGTICAYSTRSDFGDIMIHLPQLSERRSAKYWKAREQYFSTFRGSARAIPGLALDAWLAGGASLHVLARQDEYFTVSTQMYQERSRQLLITLARAVLERLEP